MANENKSHMIAINSIMMEMNLLQQDIHTQLETDQKRLDKITEN
jgi:hypothetical protein